MNEFNVDNVEVEEKNEETAFIQDQNENLSIEN